MTESGISLAANKLALIHSGIVTLVVFSIIHVSSWNESLRSYFSRSSTQCCWPGPYRRLSRQLGDFPLTPRFTATKHGPTFDWECWPSPHGSGFLTQVSQKRNKLTFNNFSNILNGTVYLSRCWIQ